MDLSLSDLAISSEQLLANGFEHPGPLTLLLVFTGGFLTSLGPCSLSLMPITVAYLAGFDSPNQNPFQRSISFCSGIVLALILLGSLSGLVGKIYGQLPFVITPLVAGLAIVMGLNLLGILKIPLPVGPNPNLFREKVPTQLAPITTGFSFGLAASPCTTPVLAVLLSWIAQTGNPLVGILLLSFFGIGQVIPLFIAGTVAASIPHLLELRIYGRWIPPISGVILITTGSLTLLARWI